MITDFWWIFPVFLLVVAWIAVQNILNRGPKVDLENRIAILKRGQQLRFQEESAHSTIVVQFTPQGKFYAGDSLDDFTKPVGGDIWLRGGTIKSRWTSDQHRMIVTWPRHFQLLGY